MDLNEKQSKTGADGESTGSEASKTQSHPPGTPSIGAASKPDTSQEDGGEAPSTRASQNCNQSDPAQDTIAAFLGKREDNAARYLEIIEEMLNDYEGYHWAESTLIDIYDFIEEHGYISEGQMTAVDNIRNSNTYGNRHRKSSRSRR